VKGVVCDFLFGGMAGGDVAVDDDELFDLSFGVADGARGGFENAPGTVFVADAVLETLADAGFAGLARSVENPRAIVGMNLLEGWRAREFRSGVSENLLVGRTIVKAAPLDVDKGDHVGGVLGDDLEEFFAMGGAVRREDDPDLLGEEEKSEGEKDRPSNRKKDGYFAGEHVGAESHARPGLFDMRGSRSTGCLSMERLLGRSADAGKT
jgi:hypothetical protein